MKTTFFTFLMLFLPTLIFCQNNYTVSGRIVGRDGKPLPYIGISTANFEIGTLSDAEGKYVLKLPEGQQILRIKSMGYKDILDTLMLSANVERNYGMEEEDLTLEDVFITGDGRDPAYGIIQKAIDRKKKNELPFPEYQYSSYTKTVISFPQTFKIDSMDLDLSGILGAKKKGKDDKKKKKRDPEEEAYLKSKILYLSETVSDVYIKAPEKAKEVITSSRVSGDSENFSLFGNLAMKVNIYDNHINVEDNESRGIISPISDNALFYYDYKLVGVGKENGIKYYKIKLIPKREYDPIFFGWVYIADSSFAIKEIEVRCSKTQQLALMDSLRLHQQFIYYNDNWLPINTLMGFVIALDVGAVKIPINGFSTSVLSDFNTKPTFTSRFFNAELISVADSALQKSRSYWEEIRPIPLTLAESYDYRLKDSLERAQKSPAYLDSLQRKTNKINVLSLLTTGQTFRYYAADATFTVKPLIEAVGFNPMEGGYVNATAIYNKKWQSKRQWEIEPTLRYGFANKKFSYQLRTQFVTNPKWKESVELMGGDYVHQFGNIQQIDPHIATLAALYRKKNFIRLYQQKFLSFTYQRDILNGLKFKANVGYFDRTGLNQNLSNYTWTKKHRNEDYAQNIAGNGQNSLFPIANQLPDFQRNKALIAEFTLSYRPGNKYISVPHERIEIGSKFPLFSATYTKAFSMGANSANFDKIQASISDETNMGIFGTSKWKVSAGKFLSAKNVYFPDLFHYKGNETYVHFEGYEAFYLMPYYRFASTASYIEAHWEHNFNGFLLNKIPLIRKLRFDEYVGLHGLYQMNNNPYVELNVGLEKKILKVLPIRIDFNLRLLGNYSDIPKMGYKIMTQNVIQNGSISL